MNTTAMTPDFDKAILGIAQAYGPYSFWLENINPAMNPDATWRALLVASALKDPVILQQLPWLLRSPDSRVRAWTCYYLGAINHTPASDMIFALTNDASSRVRFHARQALSKLHTGSEAELASHKHFMHPQFQVLISDDSPQGRNIIATRLNRKGFFTHEAGTEQETITKACEIKPQVIITDNQKGRDNLSGLNMTWDICRHPKLRETIIIMLTADHIEPVFIWSGGDYFLNKLRFGGAMLAEAVEQYMR